MRPRSAELVAVLALGAALRLWGLGDVYPVIDEYLQAFQALSSRTLPDLLRLVREAPHHVLGEPLLTWLVSRAGDDLALLRAPAALAGAAAPLAVWLWSRSALAALIVAVNLLHVDWSRRVDFYGALPLLSALQGALLLRGAWAGYAACLTAFAYMHPYAALQPPLHALYLLWKRRPLAPLLKACAAAALAFLPWYLWSARRLTTLTDFDLGGAPGSLSLAEFLLRLPLAFGSLPEAAPGREWGLTPGALLSLALLAGVLRSRSKEPAHELARLMLPLGTAAVVGLDWLYGYYLSSRQLLWLLPAWAVLAADGLSRRPRPAMVLVAALALPGWLRATSFQRAMTDRLEEIAAAVDTPEVTFSSRRLLMSFLFHYDRAAFARTGTVRLIDGRFEFVGEGPVRARGRLLAVGARKPSAWHLEGDMYDLKATPPGLPAR